MSGRGASKISKYWIYAILCESEPAFVKFGYAQNVKSRFHTAQCGCPFKLTLVGAVAGGREQERQLHTALKDYHSRGEWFRYEGLARMAADCIASSCNARLNSIAQAGGQDGAYYRRLSSIYRGGKELAAS